MIKFDINIKDIVSGLLKKGIYIRFRVWGKEPKIIWDYDKRAKENIEKELKKIRGDKNGKDT